MAALAEVITMPEPAHVNDCADLAQKTVFVKVRFGSLGNSRKVNDNVLETDADKELLKVSKTLLDSAELEAVRKADGKMRQYLYNTCLPFDIGIMLLPCGLIADVHKRLTEYREKRAELVSAFLAVYPELCKQAALRLGSLYNPGDYPSAEAVKAKFVFDWQYVSFGVPGQLKGISSGLFESEQAKASAMMKAAAEDITVLMRQTLLEMVSHLQERLTPGDDGKAKILRESAVKNLQEFLNTFDLRNVTDDKALQSQVAKVKALISGTNAEALRNSDVFRDKIRAGMSEVSSSLSTMVEDKASRKFRTDD